MRLNVCAILVLLTLIVSGLSCETRNHEEKAPTEFQVISTDPLPSWNDVASKKAIIDFVKGAIDPEGENYIPEGGRIATFDNDGNLWSEQPLYFQLFFVMDRIKELASEHPEWNNTEPYRSVLNNDMEGLKKTGMEGLMTLMMSSHAGMDTDEFDDIVKKWINSARHPMTGLRFDQMVYQPMLELLTYLQANNFKTYIVSGGGVDFMRAIFTEIYNIPKEQIIGSRIKTEYHYNDGAPKILRLPELDYNDDKEGKPLNIQKIIGKKPVFASGNSDGDLQMLQWTASNEYKSFMLYLHHTDGEREWAYDRDSHIGRLDKGLDQALADGWTIIDMKNDWKTIYPEPHDK